MFGENKRRQTLINVALLLCWMRKP